MRAALVVLAFTALVALPGAHAGSAADPGLTGNSILLGGPVPLTGPAAAFASVAAGADAYFEAAKEVAARG